MCFPGFHDWAKAESWKWEIKVCRKCGARREFEKTTGGYSPQPDPMNPNKPATPPRTPKTPD